MAELPVRGAAVRELDLALPPRRLQLFRGRRPLKQWRYIGVYGPELMLCAGVARIGPLPRRWWAIAYPDGTLREGSDGIELKAGSLSVRDGEREISLLWQEEAGMEIVSPHGGEWIWTRKFAPLAVSGFVDGEPFAADGLVDESAGYHARSTAWHWSAGVGRGVGGERVAWNLVAGVHDGDPSENTVWIDGEERQPGPVPFHGLEGVGDLRFSAWASRDEDSNLLIFRNSYRQPFGTFEGELPGGGPRLAEGHGVMEWHDVRW
ncbi:MAG: DUF2804 family protein [Thermoleophilaceae bacterium]|nr:DUF2804 family protein [Thermoleophilaceae bacterium]